MSDSSPYLRRDVAEFMYGALDSFSRPEGTDEALQAITSLLGAEDSSVVDSTVMTLFGALHISLRETLLDPPSSPEDFSPLVNSGLRYFAPLGLADELSAEWLKEAYQLGVQYPRPPKVAALEELVVLIYGGLVALYTVLSVPDDEKILGPRGKEVLEINSHSVLREEILDVEGRLTVVFAAMGFRNVDIELAEN